MLQAGSDGAGLSALRSIVEIALTLDHSPKTIISRIRKLEEFGVIVGYKSFIDYAILGYNQYKISFVLFKITPQKESELIEFCKQHPNIIYLERYAGGADVELGIHVKNISELRQVLAQIKERFVGILRDHQILHIYEEHKNIYFPLKD